MLRQIDPAGPRREHAKADVRRVVTGVQRTPGISCTRTDASKHSMQLGKRHPRWCSKTRDVHLENVLTYNSLVDVAISELRAHLREWLHRARDGEEVVVTERGVPVARLLGITAAATLERLTAEGVIARPEQARRTMAAGRPRPRPRRPVSTLVSEQRR